jgi:uncharacterized protein (TIGR03437 family)
MDLNMLRTVCLLAGASVALAQQYTIATVAGGAPPSTPATATSTGIGRPNRVTLDSSGNLYFSSSINCVFKLSSSGVLTLVAGNSRAGFSGDGGAATAAQLNSPHGLVLDGSGNLYIADSGNDRVRMVTPGGIISTFAGNGQFSATSSPGTFNDGGPATQALLHNPMGLAIDSSGDIYIADTGDNLIREVTTDGNITSVAGDGYPSYAGDPTTTVAPIPPSPANVAELNHPEDVALDSSGNIYIADTANGRVREIVSGNISTIAGSTTIGYAGDGAAATSADLFAPYALALDSKANVYIVENADSRIREVTVSNAYINTIVGNGISGFFGDGAAATSAELNSPTGIAIDSSGNLYIADSQNLVIRKVSNSNISSIAGNHIYAYSGDNGPATSAQLNTPLGVATDAGGDVYIADSANNVVRMVTKGGAIYNVLGNGVASTSGLSNPEGLVVDSSGNLYIADSQNARVQKVTPSGSVSTVAGNGKPGYGGDGGAATSAQLNAPLGLALDSAGNLYISDFSNNRVRKVSASGTITTVAGTGMTGYSGDGAAATNAQLTNPEGLAVDFAGNLYIADSGNNAVRRVSSSGLISTVAGNGFAGYSGDGGPAIQAMVGNPFGVAVDAVGNLYISDFSLRVRKVYPDGTINTIAGTSAAGYSGDGGPALSATLNRPSALAVNSNGTVYVADSANSAIRSLVPSGPGVTLAAVVNGASGATGAIAPGEVAVLWGSGLGPSQLAQSSLTSSGLVPTTLAGTSVYVNGLPAPLLYTSSNQVGAIVPFGVSGSSAQVFVLYQGQNSSPLTVPVAATAPGLFTLSANGAGPVLAVNDADGSINGPAHPASAGSYVTLYVTGGGQTNPPGSDGLPGSAGVPAPLPNANVTATIGGKNATVSYAGSAANLVAGVIQVNLVIPSGLTAGAVPVALQIGGVSTQSAVTIVVSGT